MDENKRKPPPHIAGPLPASPITDTFYLGRYFIRKFYGDRSLGYASILSYITIITFVPLVSLLIVFGTKFIRGEREISMITAALLPNLLPETGAVIRDYLLQLIHSRESAITVFSVILALVCIASVVYTLQNIFDVVWKKRTRSSFIRRYLILIGMLIISVPTLVLIAAASRYIALENYAFKVIFMNMASAVTFGVIFMMLFFLYSILPGTQVPRRTALIGAGFATMVWYVSKSAFLLYVHHFATYDRMYGSLSVIPVFLLWVYISAACLIAGCQFTYVVTYRRNIIASRDHGSDFRSYANYYALRMLRIVDSDYRSGTAPTPAHRIINALECPYDECILLLRRLIRMRVILRTSRGYVPRRDIASVAVGDVLKAVRISRFRVPPGRTDAFDTRIRKIFARLTASQDRALAGVRFGSLI